MTNTNGPKVRIVTAASLFDGHDAAINIMRRILQSKGVEIIHLGHNRSVKEIVETAIEEDVQGIAITSYQGGHMEFFKYMKDLLEENAGHDAERYIPFVGSISVFILFANLMGAFPNTFLAAPTDVVTVPLACAVLTFCYFNYHGVRHHGPVGYLGHFAGPVPALSWLILPVEIISATARILSLTVRLWANIFASDLLIAIFLGLFSGVAVWGWERSPILGVLLSIFAAIIPIAFFLLHIFVSIVQAYVFTILPSVYLGIATSEEH